MLIRSGKWSASEFDATNIKTFRRAYPKGENFVVVNDVMRSFYRTYDNILVKFVSLTDLIDKQKL